jgi:hypothetical protein
MRHTETQKGEEARVSATVGLLVSALVLVVLVLIGFVFVFSTGGGPTPTFTTDVSTSQSPGEVGITIVDPGNADSLFLGAPDGTSSSGFVSGFQSGAKITIRSNATVHRYLENNSVRIPAEGGGFMTIDKPKDVTTTQLSFQEDYLSGTNYTPHTAYLACLYEPEGFELDGEPVPSNVSIPCHTPVLAQTDIDGIYPYGNTTTVPILLKTGEYNIGDYYLIGVLDGERGVVEELEVSEETAGQ